MGGGGGFSPTGFDSGNVNMNMNMPSQPIPGAPYGPTPGGEPSYG